MMTLSERGLAFTKMREGWRSGAYKDCAGIPTIGYGSTGPNIHMGLVWTEAQASARLLRDMGDAIACVNACVTVSLSQSQFDALVDFVYNAGRGAFRGSTLLRKLNAGDYSGACAEFGNWVHAGGAVVGGLVSRREAEAEMFKETR